MSCYCDLVMQSPEQEASRSRARLSPDQSAMVKIVPRDPQCHCSYKAVAAEHSALSDVSIILLLIETNSKCTEGQNSAGKQTLALSFLRETTCVAYRTVSEPKNLAAPLFFSRPFLTRCEPPVLPADVPAPRLASRPWSVTPLQCPSLHRAFVHIARAGTQDSNHMFPIA